MVGHLADIITCAKFQDDIFRGYYFTGVEFPIFQLIFAWAVQQCSATALPVIKIDLVHYYSTGLNYASVAGVSMRKVK